MQYHEWNLIFLFQAKYNAFGIDPFIAQKTDNARRMIFLIADTHLYKMLCPSIRPFVHQSLRRRGFESHRCHQVAN